MSIRGRLIVDGNYQIRGGEIKMWPGSEIQVAGSLTLMNVNQNGGVHGCDKMWKGISAGWSTRVIVHNSTVQDAQYAIKYNSGARVDVSRSTFTDNFVSIYVPSSFLPVTTLFPHKITGTTFNTTGSLLPPYPGMEPYDNPLNIPYAGIWINTIPNTVLGVGSPDSLSNNFLDLRSGIISYDAKLSVSNSVFKAITDGVPLYPGGFSVGAGHAIYVSGANSKSLTVNGCTFENCQVALMANNGHVSSFTNNNIIGCVMGVVSLDLFPSGGIPVFPGQITRDLVIQNNPLMDCEICVAALGFKNLKNFNVSNNAMTVRPVAGNGPLAIFGIVVQGFSPITATATNKVEGNTVTFQNFTTESVTGLSLTNMAGTNVSANTISGVGRISGIQLYETTGIKVLDNTLLLSSGFQTRGIYLANAKNTELGCNDTYTNEYGMHLFGSCETSTIRGNNLYDFGGVNLFYQNAVSGVQTHRGNQWFGVNPAVPTDIGARYAGDPELIIFSQYITHTNVLPYHPVNISAPASSVPWFTVDFGSPYSCPTLAPPSDEDPNLNILVAEDGFENAGYGKGIQWIGDKRLYDRLKAKPALITPGVVQSFFNSAAAGNLHTFWQIEGYVNNLYKLSATEEADLSALEAAIAQLGDEMTDLLAQWEATNNSAYLQQYNSKEQQLQQKINDLSAWETAVQQARQTVINQAIQLNNGITPVDLPQQNDKTVYGIWLAQAAANWSGLSGSEQIQLEGVADQCVEDGGNAIYRAAAMLYRFSATECEDQQAFSAAPTQGTEMQAFAMPDVYPNPANGVITINPAIENATELLLLDARGQLIRRFVVNGSGQTLDLSGLPAGIYAYRLLAEEQPARQGKLVVSK